MLFRVWTFVLFCALWTDASGAYDSNNYGMPLYRREVQIGALLDYKPKINNLMLEFAAKEANENILKETGIKLTIETSDIEYQNEFLAIIKLCELLPKKMVAIFGPKSKAASAHVGSFCDAKEIPYIDTYFDVNAKRSVVNMYPSHDTLGTLLMDIINEWQWESFVILYESPSWLARISTLLEIHNDNENRIMIYRLLVGRPEFRAVLNKVKTAGVVRIVIQCSVDLLPDVLKQALQVGLFSEDRHIIIADLDAQTIDLEPYQYSGANVTVFRIVDPSTEKMDAFLQFQEQIDLNIDDDDEDENDDERTGAEKGIEQTVCAVDSDVSTSGIMDIHTALIYDGVMILAEALKQLDQIEPISIDCDDKSSVWPVGLTLTNYIKSSQNAGLTGVIEFDNLGLRSNISIDIMDLRWDGLSTIGTWKSGVNYRVNITKPDKPTYGSDDSGPISNKTFRVIIAKSTPYNMFKEVTAELSGNDRFEGFAIDLIDELSQLLGFKYEFILQENGDYGNPIGESKLWSGMIGEVMENRADLAITDLTVTSERISVLDFTPSFMTLGIAILFEKPTVKPPSTFSFMNPFSQEVWMCLGLSYITVSMCFFCLGRLCRSQWENPYPCIEEPTCLENQFSFQNSMWFAIGALLQQGSEIEVKAASIRLAASVWWFFTLIMVSSYTANLAAFLVVPNKVSPFYKAQDLANCSISQEQCPISGFGAKSSGSTINFFKNSNDTDFRQIYDYMMAHPEYMFTSNEEGLAKVKEGDYAFFMESSSIDYYTERVCNLTQVGELLDDKSYGIGMRQHYKYFDELSEGVLILLERGRLTELKTRWWKQRRGGGACSDDDEGGDAVPLQMANVIGVFYVLVGGTLFSILYAVVAFCFNVYKEAQKNKAPLKEEFRAELKFLLKFKGSVKPVRHRQSASISQQSNASLHSNRSQSQYSRTAEKTNQINGSNALLTFRKDS